MKVAIIEDDELLALNVGKKLKRNGYEIVISNSIEDFKKNVLDNANLFIIDIGLSDGSGFDLVKWLREEKNTTTPILIMSGYADIDNKLKGFNLGIDDYICKPVIPEELVARVGALLRRGTKVIKTKCEYKDYMFDFEFKKIYKCEKEIDLTRKELQIIEMLLLHKGKLVKKDDLIKSVWGYQDLLDVTENTINSTICKMRKKLGKDFEMTTLSGYGYILK